MSARDFEKARHGLEALPEDKDWVKDDERRKAACPWRRALEQEAGSEESVALLQEISDKLEKSGGGALRTPMGALVVGADATLQVLSNEDPFSVREYWKRMNEVHMPMHLGMDAKPRPGPVTPVRGPDWSKQVREVKQGEYDGDSIANEYIYRVRRAEAFCRALEVTRREFGKAERETLQHAMKSLALSGGGGPRAELRVTVDLWGFAERVIADLSRHWFAIPDGTHVLFGGEPKEPDDEKAYCPSDFVLFSRHVFRPDPDEHVQAQAAARGAVVMKAAKRAIERRREHQKGPPHPFLDFLAKKDPKIDVVVRRAVGAIDGFVAANWGSFLGVARKWLGEPPSSTRARGPTLWRIQREHRQQIHNLKAEAANLADRLDEQEPFARNDERLQVLEGLLGDDEPLVAQVIEVLKKDPVPAWLHRFAVGDAKLKSTPIRKGERVIVHLGRAATDKKNPADAADILFGGLYTPGPEREYLHACPGRDLAMGVLMGMLVGLLELRDVRKESTVTISFSPRGIGAPTVPLLPLVPPNPDDPRKLSVEDHRLWIGVLGFFLPVVAYLVAGIFPGERCDVRWDPLDDVSGYFHTSAVSVFCGMLVAMSGFLVTFRGYDRKDVWTARIAGVSGAAVACFPTSKSWPEGYTCDVSMRAQWWPCWSRYVHVTAAAVMFVCLILLAVWLFRKSEDERKRSHPRHERPVEKRFRDDLCLILAMIMSAALAWIGIAFGSGQEFAGKLSLDMGLVGAPVGAWMALGLLFLCVLTSVGLFRRSLQKERDAPNERLQHERVGIWLVLIAAITGGIGCLLALRSLRDASGEPHALVTLVPEVLAIWAFAISWVVKSQHRWTDPWVDRFRRVLARIGWRYKLLPP